MFKPMLADHVDFKILKYPVVASPKLDGVRATFVNGHLRTRSLKPLANLRVDLNFKFDVPLDGELIVGDPTSSSVFRDTMKVVSNHTAPIDDLRFYVFDLVDEEETFTDRFETAASAIQGLAHITLVPHVMIHSEKDLLLQEEQCLDEGFEGLMLRDPKGKYKYGRSTAREGGLLKLKRKVTSEARVTGFEEQLHNANELKKDNLGHAERSSHQENMVPMDTLGALQVRDLQSGVDFNIGTGFTFADRHEIWKNRAKFLGKVVTYEFLPIGVKDKPRHPVFLGWRMEDDL
jgi:DNA ligase-1